MQYKMNVIIIIIINVIVGVVFRAPHHTYYYNAYIIKCCLRDVGGA